MASRGVRPTQRPTFSGTPFGARFTNVAVAAGLTKPVIYGNPSRSDYILESMGCGCALFDFDNDGWLDILLLTGRRFQPTPYADTTIRLYKNNRNGTFTEVTKQAGLGANVWSSGVTIGDYDNDGFDDIFVTCWGKNMLFHNNGDGTFTNVTKRAGLGVDSRRYATGCTWIDYDRDGHLDLFVSHYVKFDTTTIPPAGKDPACNWKGIPVNCGPTGLEHEGYRMYRNNGDGTFTDVSEKSGISRTPPGYALTVAAADFDNDGWPDIYVACDTSPSHLFLNNHDGTFREAGLERGVALNEDGREQAGMGIGVGDLNLDGYLDLFKTHFSEDMPVLYENDGKGNFRDVTIQAGLGVETRYVGWGCGIADFDNNGLPDLLYTTGMIYPEIESKFPQYPYRTPTVLFRNLGKGRFEELLTQAGPAFAEVHSSRGLALGDFDNDGDVDVLIVNLNEPPSLLRNDVTSAGHWLKVLLIGTQSNRSAIGAQVIATYGQRRQAQTVLAQSSYLSASDRRLHFGLGDATGATLEIRWPSGKFEVLKAVLANQLVEIQEGKGVVRSHRWKR